VTTLNDIDICSRFADTILRIKAVLKNERIEIDSNKAFELWDYYSQNIHYVSWLDIGDYSDKILLKILLKLLDNEIIDPIDDDVFNDDYENSPNNKNNHSDSHIGG